MNQFLSSRPISIELIGLLIALALLITIAVSLGVGPISDALVKISPLAILSALLLLALAVALGAYNVYLFLPGEMISYLRCLKLYWIAWAIGLFVPGQVADAVSLSYALTKHGVDVRRAAAAILLDKLISFCVMFMMAGIGLMQLLGTSVYDSLSLQASGTLLTAATLAGFLVVTIGIISVLRLRTRSDAWPNFVSVFSQLGGLAAVLKNVCGTLLKFLLIGLVYLLLLNQVSNNTLPYSLVTSLALASGLVAYIPISFNGIGTVELTAVFLFGRLGVPSAAVFSAYLVLRASNLLLGCAPAGFWLM